jgi:hypothetical protein
VSFYSKYQLERLLSDGPAKTFKAVENSSGRAVFLHVFNSGGRLLFDTIAARFRDSAGRPRPPLIETGESEGSLFAVTEVIEPFTNLSAWAESIGAGLMAAPAAQPESRPVAGSATKEPGEFTRMFAAQLGAVPNAAQPVPTEAASEKKEPGAFTREFMVQAPAAPKAVQPPASSQPAWPPEPPPPGPVKVSKPEAVRAIEKPTWPAEKPGRSDDISDLFNSVLPGEPIDVEAEQARAARAAPPETKPFRRAGTFTRMFGAPRSVRKSKPSDRARTDAFLFESGLDSKAAKVADSKINPTKERGPGEYTRMVAIPQQTEEPQPPLPQPAQLAPPAPTLQGNRALVIAFVVIGVLIIAVIVLAVLLYSKR